MCCKAFGLPTGKVWRGGDGTFVRVVQQRNVKLVSRWPACIGTCNKNMTLITAGPVSKMSEPTLMGLTRTGIHTDTSLQKMWAIGVFRCMILAFIPLWVERYKCHVVSAVWFCVALIVLVGEGLVFISHGDCLARWTRDSPVVLMHFAVTMLIR